MVTKQATIDVWKAYKTPIEIVQYEGDGRVLNFVLTSGGSAIDLTSATVVFNAEKPVSGEQIYNSCTITDATAGKVSFTVTTQACLEAGEMTCFIEITTATPTVLRTQPFIITVVASDDVSGAVESTSEFTELTTALATVSAYDSRITQNESDISDNAADIAAKVAGAGTVTDSNIVQFDGTDGKTIKGGKAIVTSISGPGSDNNVPTEKAVVDYAAIVCEMTGPGSSTDNGLALFDGTGGNTLKEASGLSGIMKGNGATLATATPHSDYATQPVKVDKTLTAAGWLGASISDESPSTDISGGSDNKLKIQVDGDSAEEITLTLVNCDTGSNTAADLQSKIQALGGNKASVTAEYIGGKYKITSPDDGLVVITDGDTANVADDLKLGVDNGGSEGETQVISDAAIYGDGDTCHGDLKISQSSTKAERAAFVGGQIFVVGQAIGSLIVIVDETTPTIDLPVEIEVR